MTTVLKKLVSRGAVHKQALPLIRSHVFTLNGRDLLRQQAILSLNTFPRPSPAFDRIQRNPRLRLDGGLRYHNRCRRAAI